MKKYLIILVSFLSFNSVAFSQIETTHLYEFSISYMQMKESLVATSQYLEKPTWNGVGLGFGIGAFHFDKLNVYLDINANIGWDKGYYTLGLPIGLNFGYDIFSKGDNFYVSPHVGVGFMSNMLFKSSGYGGIGGFAVNDDEHLTQYSGYFPLGAKIYFKRFFLDFTYKIRFLKGSVMIESNEEIANSFTDYKMDSRPISSIKSFPWTISLGFCF
ncbi:MAG: hypothetical protein MJZ71_00510 [Bacteroidales bacterium]|nr:hypothetical protein [Bacteroidales bacterium]